MPTIPRHKIPIRVPYRVLSAWLAADVGALTAFAALRPHRAVMNAWTARFASPLQAALGKLCSYAPFSVMEWLIALLIVGAALYVAWSVRAVAQAQARGRRVRRAVTAVWGASCAALGLVALFCWMWGAYFWADSFQDKSGLYAVPVSTEKLESVTAFFADGLKKR